MMPQSEKARSPTNAHAQCARDPGYKWALIGLDLEVRKNEKEDGDGAEERGMKVQWPTLNKCQLVGFCPCNATKCTRYPIIFRCTSYMTFCKSAIIKR